MARLISLPIIISLLVIGCGGDGASSEIRTPSPRPSPSTYSATGSFTLVDGVWDVGESCPGSGGYSDIRTGTQVTVRNQDGTILATSRLGGGTATTLVRCEFLFEVASLPEAAFYSFEVSHRGEITYSFEDMKASSWDVGLILR